MDGGSGWDWALSLSSAFFFFRRFLGFSLGGGCGGAVPMSPAPPWGSGMLGWLNPAAQAGKMRSLSILNVPFLCHSCWIIHHHSFHSIYPCFFLCFNFILYIILSPCHFQRSSVCANVKITMDCADHRKRARYKDLFSLFFSVTVIFSLFSLFCDYNVIFLFSPCSFL